MSTDNNILNPNIDNVNNNFSLILQGKPINALATLSDTSFSNTDRFTQSADTSINGVLIKINNMKDITINIATIRVLDYILLKMTKLLPYNRVNPVTDDKLEKWQFISMSVSDYMSQCGISFRQRAKEQIINALELFSRISLSWTEPVKNKKKTNYNTFNIDIVSAFKIVRGKILIHFDLKFLRYLSSFAYLMPFNVNIFKINLHKHPLSYQIARRLLLHHNMNYSKTNANTITVKKIIESLPDLPKYGDVINKGRQVKQLIISPLERDINHLKELDILSNWSYDNSSNTYKEWVKSSISFIVADYPKKEKK